MEPLRGNDARRIPTRAEAAELRALAAAIYGTDSEADRAQALRAALTHPDDALTCYRAIASARGLSINLAPEKSCKTCAHAARPGLRNLHCGGDRPDLAPAYGPGHPLRQLPTDCGASCDSWQSTI